MQGKYKVVTLCGSTKFKNEFIRVQKDLTLKGYIVISVGLFGPSGDNEVWAKETKEMLDDMHKRKIDMADEIFVINVGGYIGDSTRSEIFYAMSKKMPITFLEPTTEFENAIMFVQFSELKSGQKFYCNGRHYIKIDKQFDNFCNAIDLLDNRVTMFSPRASVSLNID